MRIREIKPQDNQSMKEILQQDLENSGMPLHGTAYYDKNLDTLSQFYDADDKRIYFVIVDDNDQVLGGAGCAEYDANNGVAELQKLYLSKSAQGNGLSYKLIDLVETFAKRVGYQELYLETYHLLHAAMHVYQKSGFKKLDGPLKTAVHNTCDEFYVKTL